VGIGADGKEGEKEEEEAEAASSNAGPRSVSLVVNNEKGQHCDMQVVTSVVELPDSWARWLWLHSLPSSAQVRNTPLHPTPPRNGASAYSPRFKLQIPHPDHIEHRNPTSNIEHPTSNIQHPTSNIPTSNPDIVYA